MLYTKRAIVFCALYRDKHMKRKLLLILICVLSFGVFLFSGMQLLLDRREYRAGQDAYQELTQYIYSEPAPVLQEQEVEEAVQAVQNVPAEQADDVSPEIPSADPDYNESVIWPEVDFEALEAINPDIAAWLYLEETGINYPVVQGTDNEEYLDRLFDGSHNRLGSVFIDYRNSPDFTDRNTILYGHHAKDGLMFTPIIHYKEQAYYESHPSCLILTPEENYVVTFFAGYVADLNDSAW